MLTPAVTARSQRHLRLPAFADRIQEAVLRVLEEGRVTTPDIGGSSKTHEFVDAVIHAMK